MCGRFTLRRPERVRMAGVAEDQFSALVPRYNIAPSQSILAVTHADEKPTLSWFRWGLIPSWSKDSAGFINARAETVQLKQSFTESFRERRCLIPADGFFEWARAGKKMKQPYFFQMKDETPFAFAGIWDRWRGTGEEITSCAIITTACNDLLAPIHDRMPVILKPESYSAWLSNGEPEELDDLLVPFQASEMKSFPVSSAVNRPQIDEASLVEPIDEASLITQPTLF
jgi:putative SOS response-associated peptidase YedK